MIAYIMLWLVPSAVAANLSCVLSSGATDRSNEMRQLIVLVFTRSTIDIFCICAAAAWATTLVFMTAWAFEAHRCPTLLNEIKKTKLQIYTSPQAGINILLAAAKF